MRARSAGGNIESQASRIPAAFMKAIGVAMPHPCFGMWICRRAVVRRGFARQSASGYAVDEGDALTHFCAQYGERWFVNHNVIGLFDELRRFPFGTAGLIVPFIGYPPKQRSFTIS